MKKYNPHYYAFISYSGSDEKWAKWLHKKLEYYHIPTDLCKEHSNLPKRIRPVFWYKQDLSGTKLKKALHSELNDSRFLIVICSPKSAQAYWVNDEVQAFINQGKGDKIIPFIVSGTPHSSNPKEECFPEALRKLSKEEEVRGIDIRRKEGKMHALVDVIATMFGIRFDELWKRHIRQEKSRRNKIIFTFTILVIVFSCLLLLFQHQRMVAWNEELKNTSFMANKALDYSDINLAQLIILDFFEKNKGNLSCEDSVFLEPIIRKIDIQEQISKNRVIGRKGYNIKKIEYLSKDSAVSIFDEIDYNSTNCSLYSIANGRFLGNKVYRGPLDEVRKNINSAKYNVTIEDENILVYNKINKNEYIIKNKGELDKICLNEQYNQLYVAYSYSNNPIFLYDLVRKDNSKPIVYLQEGNDCLNLFCNNSFLYIVTTKSGIGTYDIVNRRFVNYTNTPPLTSTCRTSNQNEILVSSKNFVYKLSLEGNRNPLKLTECHKNVFVEGIDVDCNGNFLLLKRLNVVRQAGGRLKGFPVVEIYDISQQRTINIIELKEFTENNFYNIYTFLVPPCNLLIVYNGKIQNVNLSTSDKKVVPIGDSTIFKIEFIKNREFVRINQRKVYECSTLKINPVLSRVKGGAINENGNYVAKSELYPIKWNNKSLKFEMSDVCKIIIRDNLKNKIISEWNDSMIQLIDNMCFSKDNLYLARLVSGYLTIWSIQNKKKISLLKVGNTYKNICSFGNYFLIKGRDHFALVDARNGKIIYEYVATNEQIIAVSNNGKTIVVAEGNHVENKPLYAICLEFEEIGNIMKKWAEHLKGRTLERSDIESLYK